MATLSLTKLEITPLDAPLGAVVTDLDGSQPIAPEVILQLKQALRDYHILIFKNQNLTDEKFLNFAFYFGSLFVPPDDIPVLASQPGSTPVIIPISNVDGGYTGTNELALHSDHKWTPYPSSGSLLYALEVPSVGGDTYWLNLNLAYEALDEVTKKRIANLQLITYNPFLNKPGEPRRKYRDDKTIPLISPVFPHPLVRIHPESGKKILNLDYATEVEVIGLDPQVGKELIEQLREHLNQPQFYYQHKWSVGDIVYWDNQSTLHYRQAFDPHERRVLKRISLAGSRPF
ncbi:taurine catabolism dioxygenase TauD/TfdA [Richelia sinica FACHB-800]|uniref:Taurine catabolism dioxygenase TauD/TfdA n=1 Tax=Richelia sinica FACHB-800 TaxID=1357546 RepID=A0A975T7C8_9NOST|nr:TauD/TfdA family dioxygenase [Richelia sinica]MBD2666185.1 TauD/TfdA family dioxygenase [Richelia sinica FACHB-800]QXE23497.1 taurine catabolism dioxygenase TauD/TfdA [Richelia sinica FACHB-800]